MNDLGRNKNFSFDTTNKITGSKNKLTPYKSFFNTLFRIFYDTSQVMLITNTEGIILRANNAAARVLGYNKSEIEKKPFNDFIVIGDNNTNFEGIIRSDIDNGQVYIRIKSGESYLCRYTVFSFFEEGIIIFSLNDIMELDSEDSYLTQQINELSKRNDEKLRLFSVLSHDLKTPLNNLDGILNLFNKDLLRQEELIDLLKKLQQQADQVRKVLNTVLGWSKTLLNSEKINLVTTDLKKLLDENIDILKIEAKKKNISILLDLDSKMIICDPNLLLIVLRNLITNAVKFSNPDKIIFINSSAYDTDFVKISIIDQGIGISEDMLKNVFNLSFSTKGIDGETGSGLGLDLCKNLIKSMQGTIWIDSIDEKGTTVNFTLPLAGNPS